ncbi:MAG: hypothetical protein GX089_01230 [Fibrobacter sp.]|jgi:hypothetical protein|nr:hypothetical protein [Fibrobacter sp.]
MVFWIKRVATILCFITFFAVLFVNLAGCTDIFDPQCLIPALIKATLSGALFWFAGFIAGDIFFKGVLTDIEVDDSNLLEGGLLQQVHLKREQQIPGGADMPFISDKMDSGK